MRNRFSPGKYSISASDLSNSWATLSTRSTDFSIEAQQPRDASAKHTLPTFATQIPPEAIPTLDEIRQRQLEHDLHITASLDNVNQRTELLRQVFRRDTVREGEMPLGDRREPDALNGEEQRLTSETAANVISTASSVEAYLFSVMPKTTTVLVNNIAAATGDSEIRDFFTFWFVSSLLFGNPYESKLMHIYIAAQSLILKSNPRIN